METRAQTLTALLQKVADGDHDAFAELAVACDGLIRARVKHVLPTTDLVDDVIQLTMLRVWRKSDGFDSTRGSATSWISRIAHNAAIDLLRIEQRNHRNIASSNRLIAEPPDPSSVVDRTWFERVVDDMLSQLPCEQREALILYFYSELSHTEISSMTRTPLGTVKSRIRRGLLNLQQLVSLDASTPEPYFVGIDRLAAISA